MNAPDRILVVGSVALDSVRTPFGEATEALGGSASYFAVSASHFAPVSMCAVVGDPAIVRRSPMWLAARSRGSFWPNILAR